MVPPLARRCAQTICFVVRRDVGSSARAEMRHTMCRCAGMDPWFLRSRGDAPFGEPSAIAASRVPPLARRCASTPALPTEAEKGSSARAEMRPL